MKSKQELREINKRLGWIPSNYKIINNVKYQLWDAYYNKNFQQMMAVKTITLPALRSRYNSVRQIIKNNTLAIYVN